MSDTRTVQKYTDKAIERAKSLTKEDYRRIKHMNKIELANYLDHLYALAYSDGYKAARDHYTKADEKVEPAAEQ